MITGFHLNLGGGYDKALDYAKRAGCKTVQIFTHNPRGFGFKELDMQAQAELLAGWKRLDIHPIYSHCNYLINLGSSENRIFHASVSTVKTELEYCRAFGCDYFVLHVGKFKDGTLEQGMAQIAKGLNSSKKEIIANNVTILLETVAGQGTEIGRTFEELNTLIAMFDKEIQPYIGVCVDTCHIFAAGYDIRTKAGVDKTIANIEATFGVKRIKLIHVNDSKGDLGDHLDRHERPGQGKIGAAGLKAFLTHPKIKDIPMVLESPWETQDDQMEDLKIINGFFA
jgi:deoxyribonuclease-4